MWSIHEMSSSMYLILVLFHPFSCQCSREDVADKVRHKIEDVPAVHIANPKTAEFQVSILSNTKKKLSAFAYFLSLRKVLCLIVVNCQWWHFIQYLSKVWYSSCNLMSNWPSFLEICSFFCKEYFPISNSWCKQILNKKNWLRLQTQS